MTHLTECDPPLVLSYDPRPIFDNFTAPNLEVLSLIVEIGQQHWNSLRNFIVASGSAKLRVLRLTMGSRPPPDIYLPEISGTTTQQSDDCSLNSTGLYFQNATGFLTLILSQSYVAGHNAWNTHI